MASDEGPISNKAMHGKSKTDERFPQAYEPAKLIAEAVNTVVDYFEGDLGLEVSATKSKMQSRGLRPRWCGTTKRPPSRMARARPLRCWK